MTDTLPLCTECGADPAANVALQKEVERLHANITQYETSITTHRKLMLSQIEELAKLRP
jgi:hypothetical protein